MAMLGGFSQFSWVLGLLCTAWVSQLAAQGPATILITGDPSCTGCGFRLEKILTLQLPESEDGWVSPYHIVESTRGDFYVADPFGRSVVRKFGRDGAFIGNVNKRGEGPGEFMYIFALAIDAHDQLHVFGNNYSIFNAVGHVTRSTSLPHGIRPNVAISAPNGDLVLIGPTLEGASTPPIHVLRNGKVLGLGAPVKADIREPFAMRMFGGRADRLGFWTGTQRNYVIEGWDIEKRQITSRVERRTHWFTPWLTWDSRSDLRPPPTRLVDARTGDDGLLYTLLSVPDAHWQRDVTSNGNVPSVGALWGRMDTIIEVLDTARKIPVAMQRMDGMLIRFVGRDKIAQVRELDSGEVVVDVFRVNFNRPRRER